MRSPSSPPLSEATGAGCPTIVHSFVDNTGEMLLVKLVAHEVQVFKVDVENGVLERCMSIGNRAIFLGE
jgi:hypothetical protein